MPSPPSLSRFPIRSRTWCRRFGNPPEPREAVAAPPPTVRQPREQPPGSFLFSPTNPPPLGRGRCRPRHRIHRDVLKTLVRQPRARFGNGIVSCVIDHCSYYPPRLQGLL